MSALARALTIDEIKTLCAAIRNEVERAGERDPDDEADLVTIEVLQEHSRAVKALADGGLSSLTDDDRAVLTGEIEDACATAEYGLSLTFSPRTNASRRYLRTTLRTIREELTAAQVTEEPETFTIHDPRLPRPSQPGDVRPHPSLSTLRASLDRLTADGDAATATAPAADRDSSESEADRTRRELTEKSVAIQAAFRPPVATVCDLEATSPNKVGGECATAPRTGAPTWRPTASEGMWIPTATVERQTDAMRAMEVENARETYCGFQYRLNSDAWRLRMNAGVNFVLVPEGAYQLGAEPAVSGSERPATSSVLPVTGSNGPSARLDSCSRWFLEAGYGDPTGMQTGGPRDRDYTVSPPRSVQLPSVMVTQTPITVGQFRALQHDRRFAGKLPTVSDVFARAHHHRRIFLGRTPEGVAVESAAAAAEEARRNNAAAEDKDAPLCVPFTVADDIARALGGYVAPIDVQEALLSGVEGLTVPYAVDDALAALGPTPVNWTASIEGGRRHIEGVSTLVTREALSDFAKGLQSPVGATGLLCPHGEWCSAVPPLVADATHENAAVREAGGPPTKSQPGTPDNASTFRVDDAPAQSEMHYAVKSLTDYGTQYTDNPAERVGFVGFTSASLCPPGDGHVTAAFRLCLPATIASSSQFEAADKAWRHRYGADLTFDDMLDSCGLNRDQWLNGPLGPLAPDAVTTDTLYGDEVLEFRLAGVDARFKAEYPHELVAFTLRCAGQGAALGGGHSDALRGPLLPFAERRPCGFALDLQQSGSSSDGDGNTSCRIVPRDAASVDAFAKRLRGEPSTLASKLSGCRVLECTAAEAGVEVDFDRPRTLALATRCRVRAAIRLHWRGDTVDTISITFVGRTLVAAPTSQ